MLKIGIIGAGAISVHHISSYKQNPECELVAISDLNVDLAKERAEEFGIKKVFKDYKELLADKEIDAVSIVTPTFTHSSIIIESLKSGKHVLCEKPPALTADEVRECVNTARETGKLLMYAFVCRFRSHVQYLKEYIDSGKMGAFVCAEGARISNCTKYNGWFCDKSKSGGILFDAAIHELDLILYLMGYPKPKTVLGCISYINNNLPSEIKGTTSQYLSQDTANYTTTVESFANANITLENGACITIKSGAVLNSVKTGNYIDISAEKAGARMEPWVEGKELELIAITDNGYFNKSVPVISSNNSFNEEINHFADCCLNKKECICKPEDAITLVEIINAIYKSAEIGKAIEF